MSVKLTVFYDGFCPLCVAEMSRLRKLDNKGVIRLVDVQQQEQMANFSEINKESALNILHGIDDNGRILKGLDVTCLAWHLVGRGWLVAPLRWPLVKGIADRVYLWFAPNRYRISGLLTGRQRCTQCGIK